MSAGTSFLNPSTIDVWRRVKGDTPGPTGNVSYTPTQLYDDLPAFIDHATRGVSDKLEFALPTGEMVEQTDICFIDGLVPQQFAGASPGDTVVVNGIAYIVEPDGRGAFVDVQPFDVVVRGNDRYLVLQATRYTDVEPSIQLHLNFGKAWEVPASSPPPMESSLNLLNSSVSGAGDLKVQDGGAAALDTSELTLALESIVTGALAMTDTSWISQRLTVGAAGSLTANGCDVDLGGPIDIESVTIDLEDVDIFGSAGGVLANAAAAIAGLAVDFTDETYVDGSNGTVASWAWDFGDSSGTSTEQNPSYTYGSPGTYSVSLTVTTTTSATCEVTISVTVS